MKFQKIWGISTTAWYVLAVFIPQYDESPNYTGPLRALFVTV